MDKDNRLPDGRDWLWGNLGLALMGGAMFSKSLIQFSVDEWGCVPPCSLASGRGTMVGVMALMAASFKRTYASTLQLPGLLNSVPQPHGRPISTHTFARDSWTLTGKSELVSCGITLPFSWVLVHTRFCLCAPGVCFPSSVEVL